MADREVAEVVEQLLQLEALRLARIRTFDLGHEIAQLAVLLLAYRARRLQLAQPLGLTLLLHAVLELFVERSRTNRYLVATVPIAMNAAIATSAPIMPA